MTEKSIQESQEELFDWSQEYFGDYEAWLEALKEKLLADEAPEEE
jgi:hypothetical protein